MELKKTLSERDIITKYILPAIEQSGWNKQTQLREEVTFTAGRIFVKGKKTKRGEKKQADIIIYYKPNIPVDVVEAKDNTHTVGAGMQQALEYAGTLDIPVAISSNGDGFVIQYRKNCGPQGADLSDRQAGGKAQAVLDALLDKYAQTGIEEIEDMKILTVDPIKDIGTPAEIVNLFGGKPQYLQAIRELENEIYKAA